MSVILNGNGQDVVRINGRALAYQGAGHVRADVPTEAALQKVKSNGLDEVFLNVRDDAGKTHRIVFYADQLDLSFTQFKKTPQVSINGRTATLVGFDQEPTTAIDGAVEGAKQGLADAFDTLSRLAQSFLGNLVGGGIGVIGAGALLSLVATATGAGAGLGAALGAIAAPLTGGALMLAAVSFGLIAINGAVKGAMTASQRQPKMDTIAGIVEEANQLPAPRIDGEILKRAIPGGSMSGDKRSGRLGSLPAGPSPVVGQPPRFRRIG